MATVKPFDPVRRDGKRRRAALLEAASDLFLEVGYEAASLNQVVARAGGSKSSIYTYFTDKAGLFEAVVDEMVAKLLVPLELTSQSEQSFQQTLLVIADRTLRVLLSPKGIGLCRIVYMESPRMPEIGAVFYKNGPDRAIRQLTYYLKSQTKAGTINCPNPSMAAEFFWGMLLHRPMLEGLCSLHQPMAENQYDAYVQAVVDDFIRSQISLCV
ncbi:MAG: TetR/AcrR family transcriptional regulator [Pseudomonadota bacterium]